MAATGVLPYSVAWGDAGSDRDHVLALGRYLPEFSLGRFRKYYERSPLGPPRFVLARRSEDGLPVGMAALFPAPAVVGETRVEGAIAGDFVIVPAHRALGPALAVQRQLLAAVGDGPAFVVGVPNQAAAPVFHRLGYRELARRTVFVRLLRSELLLRSRLPRSAARATAKVVDPALRLAGWKRRRGLPEGVTVERPDRLPDRFQALCREPQRRRPVSLERTPRVLNWKYEQDGDPAGRFRILALARWGEPAAALVYRDRGDVRTLLDVLWAEEDALDALLAEAVRDAHAQGLGAVVLPAYAWPQELERALRRCRFLGRREGPALMLFVPPASPWAEVLLDRHRWHFLAGDLDL